MDLVKLTIDDIRGLDKERQRETEVGIRRELANLRMDIYAATASKSGKKNALRKNLARLLTIRNAAKKVTPAQPAKVKAPAAAKAPKAAAKPAVKKAKKSTSK